VRRVVMISLLALCGLFAIYPSLVWLLARTFDAVDDRWLLTLGLMTFTVPMALALAAVVLAVHGLLLNRAIQEEAAEEFEELREREREMAAAMAPGGAAGAELPDGASISATRDRGSRDASNREPKAERSKGDQLKQRAKRAGRRKMRQSFRWFR
jgi:hypothetical protein